MECLECSWDQLYIGIGINAIIAFIIALFIAITFKFIVVPKIERKYEREELHVYTGVMGLVNSFDCVFKLFYHSFEQHMGNIRDLDEGEWLPNPYQKDEGYELKRKPDAEYDKAINIIKKFKEFDQKLFIKNEEMLKDCQKALSEYINKNEKYIDPGLRFYIHLYVVWTVFYVEMLRNNQNYPKKLFERFERAKKIIQLLKKEQSPGNKFTHFWKREKFEDILHIGEFAKKWQDYEECEKDYSSPACEDYKLLKN